MADVLRLVDRFGGLGGWPGAMLAQRTLRHKTQKQSFKVTYWATVDFVRIVDESGEDYLYHKSHFLFVEFPRAVTKRILDLEHAS